MSCVIMETHDKIVAEVRDLSRCVRSNIELGVHGILPTVFGKPLDVYFAELADRIEATAKWEADALHAQIDYYRQLQPKPDPDWEAICEKCRAGEEPQDCEYLGENNGCNSPIIGEHPFMPRGNGLKMRAALVQVELFLSLVERHGHPTLNPGDKCVACQGVEELRALVCKTLAAPARNCDVYDNPYDAADAWPDHEMCAGRRHLKGSCDGCTYQPARCVAKWMYKKAEEKRGDESPRTRQESEVRE